MGLATELQEHYDNFHTNGPPKVTAIIREVTKDHVSSFDFSSTIKVGDTLPPFSLSDALGKELTSQELLSKGPLLLTFYRGEWCPFCNLALSALQKNLSTIQAKGVTLVAITPELPNGTLTMTEKHELKFPVLTDLKSKYAKELGITWKQPEVMMEVFNNFGNDLDKRNGDDSHLLPVPATLLVDREGVVRNLFIDPDYTKRLEPATALEWIDAL
jgi:peroxiredoxin